MSTRANSVHPVASSSSSAAGLELHRLEQAALHLIAHMEGRADVILQGSVFTIGEYHERTQQANQWRQQLIEGQQLDYRYFSALDCVDLIKNIADRLHTLDSSTITISGDRKWTTPPVLNRLVTLLARVVVAAPVNGVNTTALARAFIPTLFGFGPELLKPQELQQTYDNIEGMIRFKVKEFGLDAVPAVSHTYRFGADEPAREHTIRVSAPDYRITVCGVEILPALCLLEGDALKRRILDRVDACLSVIRNNPAAIRHFEAEFRRSPAFALLSTSQRSTTAFFSTGCFAENGCLSFFAMRTDSVRAVDLRFANALRQEETAPVLS